MEETKIPFKITKLQEKRTKQVEKYSRVVHILLESLSLVLDNNGLLDK